VTLPNHQSYSGNEKLIFKNVVNKVGSAYDESTGVFIAPCDGTYKFAMNVAAGKGNQVSIKWTCFVINDG